ncbi:MAG: hypothetical protein H6628_05695 [Calditrichae bacterium]|nr:hypothetical protein [Calditrichota bacterium]MCB9087784.1 hypothetical protein [Calditrichia bacterium]
MRINLSGFTVAVMFFVAGLTLQAQEAARTGLQLVIPDSTHLQVLELRSGERLVGRIVEIREQEIDFQAGLGKVTVEIARIKTIRTLPASAMKNGDFWFPNPNNTRLYLSPTARMLKQGEGYFQNIWLFFNGVAVGITDNITIGGGMSVFPTDDFLSDNIFYLTPKIGVHAGSNVDLAVGALYIFLPFDDGFDDGSNSAGILYGVATLGDDNHNLTGGLGYGFANGDLADSPILMLGGEYRLGKRISFVSENWIIPDGEAALISYGLRIFGEKLSVDLSFLNASSDPIFPGAPYVDFVVNF